MATSYAAYVFSGELESELPAGIGLALFSAAVLTGITTLGSSYRGTIAAPQDAPAILLGLMGASIVTGLGESLAREEILSTVFVAIGLSTIVTGGFLLGLGVFRIGGLIRYIPFPVVGGFLAGVGWLLVRGAFTVMTGKPPQLENLAFLVEPAVMAKWLPGLLFGAVVVAITRRLRNVFALPVGLALALAGFYGTILLSGVPLPEVRAEGWLLGPFPEQGAWQPLPLTALGNLDWGLILEQITKLGTLLLVCVVALLLYASSIELAVEQDLDLNRELKTLGLANMVTGLGGGLPGYYALSVSILNHRMGAANRLTGLIAAGFCAVALFFGVEMLNYLPRPVLGGLLMYMGFTFLVEQVYESWFRLPRADYAVIVLILVVVGTFGYLEAIVVGIIAGLILFVVNYSRIDVVKHALSGATFASNVERPEAQRHYLRENGEQLLILQLQGFIFFGTANRLLNHVRQRADAPAAPPLRHVVLDFRLVTGLDSSAVISFLKMRQLAARADFRFVLSSISAEVAAQLRKGGLELGGEDGVLVFPDLHPGVEWCENDALAAQPPAREGKARETLRQQLSRVLAKRGDARAVMQYLERLAIAQGERLIVQGDPSEDLYFIESGRVSVKFEREDGTDVHVYTMGPGTLVGEVAFLLGMPRSAAVVAEQPTIAYRLGQRALERMKAEHPEAASAIHEFMARLLAERLVNTGRLLKQVLA
jgi:SulP family sulfate permease